LSFLNQHLHPKSFLLIHPSQPLLQPQPGMQFNA
jgi:hypothetical protein